MKLASYSTFGRLRLRKWCPDEKFLEDQDSWYRLIREDVRGVGFLRSMEQPSETFQIEIDLFDFIQDLRFEILEIIGLPLKPGSSPDEVKELLGEPDLFKRLRRHHYSWYEFKSIGPEPYLIRCVFQDDKGLSTVKVQRLDIQFPQSHEDLDSPPNQHQQLDEFEVLPENIKSPESPVSKVRLLMESSGDFRFLIHVRPLSGIAVEAATLMIKRLNRNHPSTIIYLRLPHADPKSGVIELTGFIDKELLFRTFVQISLKDEGHNTSQDAVVEFDQWYGK